MDYMTNQKFAMRDGLKRHFINLVELATVVLVELATIVKVKTKVVTLNHYFLQKDLE
jgi:hypothetical protein